MYTITLPKSRAKRRTSHIPKSQSLPIPLSLNGQCFIGVLKPDGVEIQNNQEDVYFRGFFGQRTSLVANSGESLKEDNTTEKHILILCFEEAFFLCFALGCLLVKEDQDVLNVDQLWEKFCELNTADQTFPVMYAAYHHFRSKGWVVKPGIKFGVHFLLYKEGPPFFHATYAVRVLSAPDSSVTTSWALLAALNRAAINAGKNVLLCYVLLSEDNSDTSLPNCLKKFQIQEMLVNRWVSNVERSDQTDITKQESF